MNNAFIYRLVFGVVAMATLCLSLPAIAQTWKSETYGNPYASISNATTHNGKVYLTTFYAGLYLSTDDGATWQPGSDAMPDGSSLRSIVSAGTNLVGSAFSGLWVSTDQGVNWTQQQNTGFAQSLAAQGATVLAAVNNVLYRSTDAGVTWNTTGFNKEVRQITFSAGAAIALTLDGDLYRSTDGGASWTMTFNGTYNYGANALAASGSNVYAQLTSLMRSTDNGETWTSVPSPTPAIAIGFNGSDLLVGGSESLYVSKDNAATFEPDPLLSVGTMAAITTSGSNVIAATMSNGVFVSGSGAYSFVASNSGMVRPAINGLAFRGTLVVAGGYYAVHYSPDGASWFKSATDLSGHIILNVVPAGSNFFAAAGDKGVLRSSDDGATWVNVSTGLSGLVVSDVGYFNANVVVATNNGLYYSSNQGTSWTLSSSGSFTKVFRAGSRLFASKAGTNGTTLLSSTDGSTWATTNLTSIYIRDVVEVSGTYFASSGTGLYQSTDGATWTVYAALSGYAIGALASDGTAAYFFDQNTYQVYRFSGVSIVNLQFYATFSSDALYLSNGRLYAVVNRFGVPQFPDGIGSIWSRSTAGLLSIQSIDPLSGKAGTLATITGQNFSSVAAENVVTIGGIRASIYHSSPTQLSVSIPNVAGSHPVVIRRSTQTATSTVGIRVLPDATVLEPSIAPVGAVVTIRGTGFGAPDVPTQVSLNNSLVNSGVQSKSAITFTVPEGATSGTVSLSIGSYAKTFPVQVLPIITQVIPSEGVPGDLIYIQGSGFSSVPGQVVVRINDQAMPLTGTGPSAVAVRVPSNAKTGTVSVTVGGLTAYSEAPFVIRTNSVFCPTLPSPPTISLIPDPPSGVAGLISSAPSGNQWFFNGVPIPGATKQALITDRSGTYSATVTIDACASAPSNHLEVVVLVLGVESSDPVRIYPNPANEKLFIDMTGETSEAQILVLGIQGNELLSGVALAGTVHTLDIGDIAPGLYVVQLRLADRLIVQKWEKR